MGKVILVNKYRGTYIFQCRHGEMQGFGHACNNPFVHAIIICKARIYSHVMDFVVIVRNLIRRNNEKIAFPVINGIIYSGPGLVVHIIILTCVIQGVCSIVDVMLSAVVNFFELRKIVHRNGVQFFLKRIPYQQYYGDDKYYCRENKPLGIYFS